MAQHPWVTQADAGVRFGVLVTGSRRRTPQGGFVLYDHPVRVITEAGRAAEVLGFDGVFVGDHPTFLPDPFLCLTALASVTDRVRLGSLVVASPLRHPVSLARLASDVDHLSGGRLVLGLGLGQVAADFHALGLSFRSVAERQAALDEVLDIVAGVWSPGPFTYQGQYFQVTSVQGVPAPAQVPRPPLVIAGGGNRTLLQVARRADACNLAGPMGAVTPDDIRRKLAILSRHCVTLNRPFDDILRTHIAVLMLAPTEATLQAKLADCFPAAFLEARAGSGYIVAGTPEKVASYYRERTAAGIQYFIAQLADTADHETLRLLATEVMPQVR
jgi:alkanesulfonate monooxygenase SsuD/methylene tetrahydromethanopterin reductase-like flavin-dependent oxidoreductase (luciferase family)